MSGVALSLNGVGFSYRANAPRVITDVSFDVRESEIIGLSGASGTGKSTVLRLIANSLFPSEGTIQRPPIDSNPFAYSPQGDILLEYRSVFENATLLLEREQSHQALLDDRLQDVDPMLDRLKLAEKRDHLPATLSGGMRQRVQFVQALAARALILLFDEPFAQQDRDNQRAMETILVAAVRQSHRAAILVSHDIDALAAVCDRTLLLAGTPARLHGSIETPESLRSLDADARRAHPGFADHNAKLWALRAEGALL